MTDKYTNKNLFEMNKKWFLYCLIVSCLLSCGRPKKVYSPYMAGNETETQQLKQRIESAKMKTYWDADYNVEVCYPDFFVVCDTAKLGTARFYYPSEQEQEISLKMFVEPNVEGWNIHEAVEHLSDPQNICQEEGDDYFIMTGQISKEPGALFIEKCYLVNGMWIDFTLYYLAEDEIAIGRLKDMVKNWTPRLRLPRDDRRKANT
jgi:hypothetical protein